MKEVSLVKYQEFVKEVTSDASNDVEVLITRLRELNEQVNISLLLTGATGLASEGGEFIELVKKCTFQGKPLDEATKYHMKRELGDIGWYWVNACRALNLDPNEVIKENVHKLEARYPGGEFNVHSSENRDANDL